LNKIFLLIPLLILIPYAAAEKIEIDIPFNFHGYSCTITDNPEELTYTCIFQGNVQTFTNQDLKEFESILTEKQVDEIIEQLKIQELELIEIEKENKKTFEDRLIERLEKKLQSGNISNDEIIHLKMLKELDKCYQGLGKSRQIQDYREFNISNYENHELKNHEYTHGYFGQLVKAVEECKAQTILENNVLSEKYNNIIGSEIKQKYHAQGLENIQAIPYDYFRENNAAIDLNAICNDFKLTQSHKKYLGCVIQYDGQSMREIEIDNIKKFGSDGIINYESEIMKNYNEFMLNYYD
jgi:hypothetical protein